MKVKVYSKREIAERIDKTTLQTLGNWSSRERKFNRNSILFDMIIVYNIRKGRILALSVTKIGSENDSGFN